MKRWLIKLVKYLMIPAGFVYSLVWPTRRTILMYHRVNDAVDKELSVTAADFAWQMAYLHKRDYHVVTLEEALHLPPTRHEKIVVLTFDDGYKDFCSAAFPLLRQYGYPALVYLVSGYIGLERVFWWDDDLGESRLMGWEQILELQKCGLVRFGSHSVEHLDFDRLDDVAAETELRQSREELERRLGVPVVHFAYPRGIVAHRERVGRHYETAVSIFVGDNLSSPRCDRLRLKRMPVQRSDGRLLFAARLHGYLVMEGWLRSVIKNP